MDVQKRPLYYLHFRNLYDRMVYIIGRVEMMKQVIKPISKENVDPTASKLSAVAESFKVKLY